MIPPLGVTLNIFESKILKLNFVGGLKDGCVTRKNCKESRDMVTLVGKEMGFFGGVAVVVEVRWCCGPMKDNVIFT